MANTDPAEWRLYSSDLTTQTDILPFKSSHIDMVLNEAGSGEVTIPLDTQAGTNVSVGNFVALYYRGSYRTGFFVENLKYTDISNGEISERMVSMSGNGALALLDKSVIWSADGLATTRTFTSVTKASILKTLIDEAQARGELSTLTYSFTASVDSAAVAWTDSENYDLAVGTTLLDVARQFAATGGFEYTLDFSAGTFNLGAYSAGRGADVHTTTYFRIGEQCEEVGRDTRGDEIYNYYLVKWKDGYVSVSDATSISTYGIRTKFLSLEQAQSSASATTYASAKLELTKNPKTNKTVKVYDGIKPRLFVDYDLGDTVSLDRFGTVSTDVIKGIQADFDGTEFSHVVIDFNYILYDSDMRLAGQLDWLSDQWATAHDGDLLEVSQGMSIGGTNGAVNTIHTYGDYVYIGGAFTTVSGLSSSRTAAYQISTHTWTALTGISAAVLQIINVGSSIYALTSANVYLLSGTAWSSVGSITAGVGLCMATDGTDLYVGGSITTISTVTINHRVAKRSAGVWSDVDPNASTYDTLSMAWFGGTLYRGSADGLSSALQYMSGGSFSNALGDILDGKWIFGLKTVGSNLIIAANSTDGSTAGTLSIYSWDGVSSGPGAGSAVLIGTITSFKPVATGVGNGSMGIGNYLTDIYIGGDFDTLDSVSGYNNIAKYSGGLWSPVGGGVSTAAGDGVTAIETVNSDVYAGGVFTTAFGIPTIDLSLFVTDFQSMLDHALNDYGGIDHERLSGLLGGTTSQHYHLTSAEYTGTGTNEFVRKTTPTLVTPVLGVATATSINKVAITAPATSATLTIANGKTLTINETLTLTAGASGQTFTLPAASDTLAGLGTANTFTVGQVINAHLSIGAGVSPNANQIFRSVETFTDASADATNINANINVTQTAANNSNVFRGFNGGVTNTNHAFNLTSATGMRGIQASAIHNGSGTVTGAVGYFVQLRNDGSGTITNAYNHYVQAPSNGGGGAITNLYGMYVEALTAGGTLNYALYTNAGLVHFGDTVDIASGKNLGVGTTTFGTSATNTLALFNGTVPSTSPADTVQLFSVDLSAGNATLGIRTETAVVTESVTSDRTLSVKINGTTYKICLKS